MLLRINRLEGKKEDMNSSYDEVSCGKGLTGCEAKDRRDHDPLSSNSVWTDIVWDREEEREEEDKSFLMQLDFPNFSLAKLSVVILALATITDMAVSHMSPDSVRPRSSLGSAAISSVTETLSPILPFTGGLDLRRDDYWTTSGNWFETLQSVALQVQSAFAGSEDVSLFEELSPNKNRSISSGGSNVRPNAVTGKYTMTMSSADPFITVDDISELTLGEVSEVFRFTVESSKEGFDMKAFEKGIEPRLKKVIDAIEVSVGKSRGIDVEECAFKSELSQTSGTVDALRFSGAMRIFAEWRIRRQVPDGYKGYAVGMNLGYKDIIQNLAKIERAVHVWLDHQKHLSETDICSPTLRQILEYEANMNVHAKLPYLKDPSGAMGLLWVRRQLSYQTRLFENVLNVPQQYPTTKDAVATAYKQVYDKYHGWAVQKIFNYSFQSAPDAELIFKQMNPRKLQQFSNACSSDGSAQVTSPEDDSRNDSDNPVHAVLKTIHVEWDKIASNTIRLFNKDHISKLEIIENHRRVQAQPSASTLNEDCIVKEMVKDAYDHIQAYLEDVNPLLDDLARLFDDMNMDDPTKV